MRSSITRRLASSSSACSARSARSSSADALSCRARLYARLLRTASPAAVATAVQAMSSRLSPPYHGSEEVIAAVTYSAVAVAAPAVQAVMRPNVDATVYRATMAAAGSAPWKSSGISDHAAAITATINTSSGARRRNRISAAAPAHVATSTASRPVPTSPASNTSTRRAAAQTVAAIAASTTTVRGAGQERSMPESLDMAEICASGRGRGTAPTGVCRSEPHRRSAIVRRHGASGRSCPRRAGSRSSRAARADPWRVTCRRNP